MISYKRSLNLSTLSENKSNNLFNFLPDNRNHFYTGTARGGIEYCLDELGLNENDSVLIPAFVAEGVISPFKKKGIIVKFYKCKENLAVNLTDLEINIRDDKSIKVVLIIHYFGFPQEIVEIKSLCNKYNVILFEDCAQALFSKDDNGELLGIYGDISFFSLPKTLPIPNGSIFFINNPDLSIDIKNINYSKSLYSILSVWFHLIFLIIKHFELKLEYSLFYKLVNVCSKTLYFLYYQSLRMMKKPTKISLFSKHILELIDYNKVLSNRIRNASYFYDNIDKTKFKLVYSNYNNYILTGVPILTKNRDSLVSMLRCKGIECLRYVKYWNFIPEDREDDFSTEIDFFNRHLLIPINENINMLEIKYIVKVMHSLQWQ